MIGRRGFLAGLGAALFLPEPSRVRAYSFLPASVPTRHRTRINGKVYDWESIQLQVGDDVRFSDFVSIDYSEADKERVQRFRYSGAAGLIGHAIQRVTPGRSA